MISRWLPLTLFAIVFAPGLLRAQPGVQRPGVQSSNTATPIDSTNYDKMYEDIEIFRRILDRKLGPLYPTHTYKTFGMAGMGGMPGMPGMSQGMGGGMGNMQNGMGIVGGMMPVTVHMRSLEGVYLKGQGVVYTTTLASLQPPTKVEADTSAPLRLGIVLRDSEWERVRRQVRNEKEKPKKPEESKPPSLSDVLLKVLAENGHHFSQLGENESLTIVLSVHETSPPSPAAKSGTGSAKVEWYSAPANSDADAQREARNLELLGELHLRKGKYQEAMMVFHKGLEQTKSPKQTAELRRKLAQCYLGLGQDEKARAELDQAIALMKKETEAKEKPAAKPTTALPVKLIISAPKKLLDQVKEGKMSFEEFRHQASVGTLRFGDRR